MKQYFNKIILKIFHNNFFSDSEESNFRKDYKSIKIIFVLAATNIL